MISETCKLLILLGVETFIDREIICFYTVVFLRVFLARVFLVKNVLDFALLFFRRCVGSIRVLY